MKNEKQTTKKISFTNYVDNAICNVKSTTNLSSIADNLNVLAKKHSNNIHYTTSVLKAHIRYRTVTQNKKQYLIANNLKLKNDCLVLINSKKVTDIVE